MADIFVSYVEEDSEVALDIAHGLEAAGYSTWYYERDSYPGISYLLQILNAIRASKALIVIVSPRALTSPQVDKEILHAHETGKHFIPILNGITHREYQERRPDWAMVTGAAVSLPVQANRIDIAISRIIRGLGHLEIHPRPAQVSPNLEAEEDRPAPPRVDERKSGPDSSPISDATSDAPAQTRTSTRRPRREEQPTPSTKPPRASIVQRLKLFVAIPMLAGLLLVGGAGAAIMIALADDDSPVEESGSTEQTGTQPTPNRSNEDAEQKAPTAANTNTQTTSVIPTSTKRSDPAQPTATLGELIDNDVLDDVPTATMPPPTPTSTIPPILPIDQQGTILLSDDFNDPDDGIFSVENTGGRLDYVDGELSVRVNEGDTSGMATTRDSFDDVIMSLDVRMVSSGKGKWVQLYCKYDYSSSSGYTFSFETEGEFRGFISRYDNREGSILESYAAPEAINAGTETNEVVVECVDEQLTISINGVELASAFDSRYEDGTFGIGIGALDEYKPAEIRFDNFTVAAPQ